ncbi:Flavin-containing monooxygenase FMO GS-OX-like 6 [Pleurostoma richardsiae]|uniref:Flavin-containing monooxygenase FMO GS-OX-like 6 n=1 Tax=Pleurostoma richardsiae TaxID=41990 RepID=A0AA38RTW4_9PEZI|nr:Flavin-containing monooxygenase FMO GS-OX-like 6 [Pleurostoma richardsiae]
MPKTVCIVGAGPAGLVAAKTLLHEAPAGAFSVTVFDAQSQIGGLWPVSRDDNDRLVHPLMVANQSKHTVQFSDLAWAKEDPELPRAWQVGHYLQRYLERYCLPLGDSFRLRLGSKVSLAEPTTEGDAGWQVRTSSADGGEESERFDFFLVASGFFGAPIIPGGLPKAAEIPIVHSSRYRNLETLLPEERRKGGKILVVGSQMSGIEIAGTVASHLSSAVNSPGSTSIAGADKYSIHHVIQRPPWVFPLFTSPKPASAAAPFLPVDLPSYNLNNRPQPLVNSQGHISEASASLMHSIYQGVLGTDQSIFSPLMTMQGDVLKEPPYLAMSDPYMDFVRSGLITLSQGKLTSLDGTTATIDPLGEKISDIAAVILATGFDPSPSLSFLPDPLLKILSLSPEHVNYPTALAFHGTHHPDIPNLGFVGFYRSPYWGVMEMQARFLATLWTNPANSALQQALDSDTSVERTLSLRNDPRSSQFPMGDYLFLMQEFAAALGMHLSSPIGVTPPLPHNGKPLDILTPARYAPLRPTPAQAAEVASSLQQTHDTAMAGLTKCKFVARAVFRSLLGEWSLERSLVSRLPSHPSGHFSGTARFLMRRGTTDGREGADVEDLGDEYLYVEEGEFRADNGMAFRATRRYVWRYDEAGDMLSVWFARTDDQKRADYLFHELEFMIPPEAEAEEANDDRGWKAKAGHLCVEDFYDVVYEFKFSAVNLKEWTIGYTVKGPKKDYTIDGVYKRVDKKAMV